VGADMIIDLWLFDGFAFMVREVYQLLLLLLLLFVFWGGAWINPSSVYNV
jgi:hypothetical protein